ncbi:MAG: hypothetical protein AAGC55_29320, partial [Myxococcota bacterium]
RDRVNPLEQRDNILATLGAADADALARLREDPAVLDRIRQLSNPGQRTYAMHLLMDSPAAKALKEIAPRLRNDQRQSHDVVAAIAKLSKDKRDALRQDQALIDYLASHINGDDLPYFRQLMGIDDSGQAMALPGTGDLDRDTAQFEQNRMLTGLRAAIAAGDHSKLVQAAIDAYENKVARPSLDPKNDPNAAPDAKAPTPTFEQRARDGQLAGDMLLDDGVRERIANELRSSPEFRQLHSERPELAAMVIDAVLGTADPSLMQYQREMAKDGTVAAPSADTLVEHINTVSPDAFLREFTNSDAFAPKLIAYYDAQPRLETARSSGDAEAIRAAETALAQSRQELRTFEFDLSERRAAELTGHGQLSTADRRKVREAVRERVLTLIGGDMGDNDAMVARAMNDGMRAERDRHKATNDDALRELEAATAALGQARQSGDQSAID